MFHRFRAPPTPNDPFTREAHGCVVIDMNAS